MTEDTSHGLNRVRSFIRWWQPVTAIIVVIVVTYGFLFADAKADRASCIDDLEVEWRIEFGLGLAEVTRGDIEAAEDRSSAVEDTTNALVGVRDGERCVYNAPWPFP